jgi:quinol monooxygenase YgiN
LSENPVRVYVSFTLPTIASAIEFSGLFRDEFIERTRKEDGCLLYDVWQSNSDPLAIVLVESWASQRALDAHLAQDWMKAILPRAMALLGENKNPPFHFCKSVMD